MDNVSIVSSCKIEFIGELCKSSTGLVDADGFIYDIKEYVFKASNLELANIKSMSFGFSIIDTKTMKNIGVESLYDNFTDALYDYNNELTVPF